MKIRDQRSEIRDQRSEIRDQRSEIRDQLSSFLRNFRPLFGGLVLTASAVMAGMGCAAEVVEVDPPKRSKMISGDDTR